MGKNQIGKIIEKRIKIARFLEQKLNEDEDFVVLNNTDMNSVMFQILGDNIYNQDLNNRNIYNKKIS